MFDAIQSREILSILGFFCNWTYNAPKKDGAALLGPGAGLAGGHYIGRVGVGGSGGGRAGARRDGARPGNTAARGGGSAGAHSYRGRLKDMKLTRAHHLAPANASGCKSADGNGKPK